MKAYEMTPEDISIMEMPLHEITQHCSLEGLVGRFKGELDAAEFPPDVRNRLDSALELALYAHAGQQPRGEHPYATHVLRVANRIISPAHFGIADPEILIAALLHDTIEDRPGMLVGKADDPENPAYREDALAFVRDCFGSAVHGLVSAVTNPEFDDSRSHHEQYREHVRESMGVHARARIIKLSDFIDNCSGLIYNEDPKRAQRLATKYLPLIPDMRDYALAPSTPLPQVARGYILERLNRAEGRCNDLIAA